MALAKRGTDAVRLLLDLVTRDPPFVRGGALDPQAIPVFTFHSLEPRSFERRMRYLRDAGYGTLTMARYMDSILGRAAAPPKSVLLTVDDGRATTWTVGYPILKRLGLRATAFLVTSAVHDSEEVSKTIDEASGTELSALIGRDDTADRPFVTWGEVRAMRDVFDIESHTHLHARIAVSGTPSSAVMTESMQRGYGAFDCPFQWLDVDGNPVRGAGVPLGSPLPDSAPRLSGRPAWRAVDQRHETDSEMRAAIAFDLGEARRLIREKAGVEASTVCYPWHVFSPVAKQIAAETGHAGAFAGKASTGKAISGPGSDPFEIARVGEDYVERLPGPGRKSLLSVLGQKARRRS
jgi:hypothetical protein